MKFTFYVLRFTLALGSFLLLHPARAAVGGIVGGSGPNAITILGGNLGYTTALLAGVGGANTNFTLRATQGDRVINGFTNVSIRAVMAYSETVAFNFSILVTNGSGANRTLEFSPVTNAWHWSYAQSAIAPTTLTNSEAILITGRIHGSNIHAAYAFYPWP